jgi:ketosteroid isomerase-like protein
MDTWERHRMDLEAPVVVGQTVVALVHHTGRAKGSGIDVEQRGAQLFRVENGMIVFWRPYTDRAEALADGGLRDPERWLDAIETLRVGYEAWNRRDFESLLALQGGVEFVPVTQSPDMPAFSGREGAEEFWRSLLETWEIFTFMPLAFEPLGSQILAEVRARARARASGIELEEEWAHLYTLRDWEFVRLQAFTSVGEARTNVAYPERG